MPPSISFDCIAHFVHSGVAHFSFFDGVRLLPPRMTINIVAINSRYQMEWMYETKFQAVARFHVHFNFSLFSQLQQLKSNIYAHSHNDTDEVTAAAVTFAFCPYDSQISRGEKLEIWNCHRLSVAVIVVIASNFSSREMKRNSYFSREVCLSVLGEFQPAHRIESKVLHREF